MTGSACCILESNNLLSTSDCIHATIKPHQLNWGASVYFHNENTAVVTASLASLIIYDYLDRSEQHFIGTHIYICSITAVNRETGKCRGRDVSVQRANAGLTLYFVLIISIQIFLGCDSLFWWRARLWRELRSIQSSAVICGRFGYVFSFRKDVFSSSEDEDDNCEAGSVSVNTNVPLPCALVTQSQLFRSVYCGGQ